jgi:hypothetical protein
MCLYAGMTMHPRFAGGSAVASLSHRCYFQAARSGIESPWTLSWTLYCRSAACSLIECSRGTQNKRLNSNSRDPLRLRCAQPRIFFRCRLILPALILDNAAALALLLLHDVWGGLLGFIRRRSPRLFPGHFGRGIAFFVPGHDV